MTYPDTPATIVTGPGFVLAAHDPAAQGPYTDEDASKARLEELRPRLAELQELLYAEHRQSLLLVFQAMDTGGKDGAIEKLLTGVNPAGVAVASFKAPSAQELNHDFLWRIHPHTPGRGHIAVFNRSHYEDVLITRVHGLIDAPTAELRYRDINHFEEMLTHHGTRILKFFLHISKDEQAERLQDRLDDPAKRWKFDPNDLKERALWDDYQQVYEMAIDRCSTPASPWLVVPANRKWVRNLAVMEIVLATLEDMNPQSPKATFDVAAQVIK